MTLMLFVFVILILCYRFGGLRTGLMSESQSTLLESLGVFRLSEKWILNIFEKLFIDSNFFYSSIMGMNLRTFEF